MAAPLVLAALREGGGSLIPIDSEHNAVFQCMPVGFEQGLASLGVSRILLTASGGPFRTRELSDLVAVTPDEACAHPKWVMGRKISVDSATMMNKGLEIIEACWLFHTHQQNVEVVVHPQSVIHSMVEYIDGELQTGEVSIFVGPQYIVSVRRDAQHGFADVRRRCEQEPELLQHGPAYVLYALMDNVVDRYFPVMGALTAEIEEVEERIFSGQTTRTQIETLYSLKRKLMLLSHVTQPLLEVTGKLHGGRVPPICAGLHDYFRDVYDHLIRLTDEVDSQRELVSGTLDVYLSTVNNNLSVIMKRLTGVTVIIAGVGSIAGLVVHALGGGILKLHAGHFIFDLGAT